MNVAVEYGIPNEYYQLMLEFEDGVIDDEDETKLFQYLVDTAIVWRLHGLYLEKVHELINDGLVEEDY